MDKKNRVTTPLLRIIKLHKKAESLKNKTQTMLHDLIYNQTIFCYLLQNFEYLVEKRHVTIYIEMT